MAIEIQFNIGMPPMVEPTEALAQLPFVAEQQAAVQEVAVPVPPPTITDDEWIKYRTIVAEYIYLLTLGFYNIFSGITYVVAAKAAVGFSTRGMSSSLGFCAGIFIGVGVVSFCSAGSQGFRVIEVEEHLRARESVHPNDVNHRKSRILYSLQGIFGVLTVVLLCTKQLSSEDSNVLIKSIIASALNIILGMMPMIKYFSRCTDDNILRHLQNRVGPLAKMKDRGLEKAMSFNGAFSMLSLLACFSFIGGKSGSDITILFGCSGASFLVFTVFFAKFGIYKDRLSVPLLGNVGGDDDRRTRVTNKINEYVQVVSLGQTLCGIMGVIVASKLYSDNLTVLVLLPIVAAVHMISGTAMSIYSCRSYRR